MARKLLGGGYRKLALLFSLFSAILLCTSFLACRNAVSGGGADPNDGPATVSKIAGPGGGKPVFITAAYSTTTNGNYDVNDAGNPKFYEGGRSVELIWKDEIPDELKPYTIMELHANNWTQTGDKKKNAKEWYDTQLAICQRLGIDNVVIVVLAAFTGPTSTTYYGFNAIDPTAQDDKAWIQSMLNKYSCLKGFVSTEHYWCANYVQLGARCAQWINFCDENSTADRNLMFYVFDGKSRHIEMVTNNNNYKTAMEDKGKDHIVFGYKYTNPTNHTQTFSYSLGEWLNGHSAAFGGLPDTWSWKEREWWTLFGGGNGGWDNKQAVQYPEGAMAIILAQMYMNGGTVWNFEAPWVTYGNSGKKSEMQASILEPLLKYTIEHPAPTREEMIGMTKHVYKQNNTNISYPTGYLVDVERGRAATDMEVIKTGRYGHIPAIISNLTESPDLAGKTSTTIDQNTWEASCPKQTLDLASGKTEGFAAKRNFAGSGNLDMWFMYNYNINPNDANADNTKKQYVKIPLTDDKSKTLEVEMTPHTLVIAKVGSGSSAGTVDIWMTNYRLDKDSAIPADWAQQVQKRDAWITENLCVAPKYERWVRDTVFTVEGSTNDVAYKIIDGQHLSGRPAYTPKVTAGGGVVTVNGNGWLRFVITY